MKKRLLASLLAVSMLLTITACKKNEEAASKPVEQSQETTEAPATEETAEEENKPEEEQVAEQGPPLFAVICTKNYYEYDDEIGKETYTGTAEGVTLGDECKDDYPKLYDTLLKLWDENVKESDKAAKQGALDARAQYDDMVSYGNDVDYMMSYSDETHVFVQRADDKVLSYSSTNSSYMGGAHGMYGTVGYTFDSQTGEELHLSDVITDMEAYGKKLYEGVKRDYSDVVYEGEDQNLESRIIDEVKNNSICWNLEPDGIRYYFNPYDIAPYAAGQQTVKVTYAEAPELFNEKYLPNEGAGFVVTGDSGFYVDTDGDGTAENIYIEGNYPEYHEGMEDYEAHGVNILINDKKVATVGEDNYAFSWTSHFIHTADGDNFLLIGTQMENDWNTMTVCRVKDGGIEELDSYNMSLTYLSYDEDTEVSKSYAIVDPRFLPLSEHFDRLGTYSAGCMYSIGSDGKLTPQEEYAYLPDSISKYMVMTSKADITADIVEEDGTVKESAATIPSGTAYHIYRTSYKEVDGGYYVDCRLDDGRIVRLIFTPGSDDNDWQNQVNGMSEWDAFDNILYAG